MFPSTNYYTELIVATLAPIAVVFAVVAYTFARHDNPAPGKVGPGNLRIQAECRRR